MAAMHYEGNFNAERTQLTAIDDSIKKELQEMESTLDDLGTFWKDEKSGPFLAAAKDFIKQVREKQGLAIHDGNDILTKVEQAFEIYEN